MQLNIFQSNKIHIAWNIIIDRKNKVKINRNFIETVEKFITKSTRQIVKSVNQKEKFFKHNWFTYNQRNKKKNWVFCYILINKRRLKH